MRGVPAWPYAVKDPLWYLVALPVHTEQEACGAKNTCPPEACCPPSRPQSGYLGSQYSQPLGLQMCLHGQCRPFSHSVFLRAAYSTCRCQSLAVCWGVHMEFGHVCWTSTCICVMVHISQYGHEPGWEDEWGQLGSAFPALLHSSTEF